MAYDVLISCPHLQKSILKYESIFEKHKINLIVPSVLQQLEEDDLVEIVPNVDGAIIGDDKFTAKVISRASRLKIISKWGVGIDNIDLNIAKKKGIVVKNTPGVFSNEVADVVIGYLILLSRKLHLINENVKNGYWDQIEGISLYSKTIGIIGLGNIGKEVCRRTLTMGMNTIAFDIVPPNEIWLSNNPVKMVDLNTLFKTSDFISLNCNLSVNTYHLLNSTTFNELKKGVYIINCSRGALIDENSLIEALAKEIVSGAALDVFEHEPIFPDSQLLKNNNVICGTHNSSNTGEAIERTNEIAINNLLDVLIK